MSQHSLSTLHLMWRFLTTQYRRIAIAVAAGVLTIVASVCLMGMSAYLIERASQQPPILSLEVAIVSVRFFGISRGIFRYLDRVVSHDASFRLLGDIRADMYRTLIPLAPAGLGDIGRGELFTRIAADIDTMQEWFVRGFAPICTSLITGFLMVVAAAVILPAAGMALAVALLTAGVLAAVVTRSRGGAIGREMKLRGSATSDIINYVQGIADLTALDATAGMALRIQDCERERNRLSASRSNRSGLAAGIQTALPGLLAVLLVAVAISHRSTGLNPLLIGVLCLGGMAAAECIVAVPGAVTAWERGHVAARRLAELTRLPVPVTATGVGTVTRPTRLTVSQVSFRYAVSSPHVIENATFDLSVGERVLIAGPSGAGKSTLAWLLLRFLSPDAGSIALDGTDISTLSEDVVRQTIGATAQHAHLFAGTIRDNIILARPNATDDELCAAIESAQLGAWIDRLPEGWNTFVGEDGAAVSGGQRRRIALARVLLAGFPFLIADEPTEGLDTPTARAVMHALFTSAADRALIVITHRPDLCTPVDRMYEIVNGHLRPMKMSSAWTGTPSAREQRASLKPVHLGGDTALHRGVR